jgi:hypothetical protein
VLSGEVRATMDLGTAPSPGIVPYVPLFTFLIPESRTPTVIRNIFSR